jgi:hypothetical protein
MNNDETKLAEAIWGKDNWNNYLEFLKIEHEFGGEPITIDEFLQKKN